MSASAEAILIYGVELDARQAKNMHAKAMAFFDENGLDLDDLESISKRALMSVGWSPRLQMIADGWHPGFSNPGWFCEHDATHLSRYAVGIRIDHAGGSDIAKTISRGADAGVEDEWHEFIEPFLASLGLPSAPSFVVAVQIL